MEIYPTSSRVLWHVHFGVFIMEIYPTSSCVLEMCSYAVEIVLDLLSQLAHGTSCNLIFLFFIFLSASRLGTVVVSDHTHALPLYTRTPPHATVYKQTYNYTQIKDRVLLEITRIFRFRRRRARHIPFVAPRMRGEREYSWETTVPGEKTSAIQGPNTGRQRAHLQR
jgi:hypothetical protein